MGTLNCDFRFNDLKYGKKSQIFNKEFYYDHPPPNSTIDQLERQSQESYMFEIVSTLTLSIWGQACKGGSQYDIFTLLHRKLKLFQNVILLTRNDFKGSFQNQVIIYPGPGS